MCGRFGQFTNPETLAEVFGLAEIPDLEPRYNIGPGQDIAVVRLEEEPGKRVVRTPRWGLIPSWAKDPSMGFRTINARVETAAEKPAFRGPWKKRRCLVPCDGFYEWKTKGKNKRPYFFHRRDGAPFALAGLWERWRSSEGETIESCTLLTTAAGDLVRPIHDRMPLILPESAYAPWLDPTRQDPADIEGFDALRPYDDLTVRPVSPYVNSVKNQGPQCIEPYEEARTTLFD